MTRRNSDRTVFDSVALKFLLGGMIPSSWKRRPDPVTFKAKSTLNNSLYVNARGTEHESQRRLIIHGLERTGTGFCTELIRRNIEYISVDDSRKHEYFDKDMRTGGLPWYYAGCSLIKYIICVRHPYSWFVSYESHHRKRCTGSDGTKGTTRLTHSCDHGNFTHYIETFNKLYSNWLSEGSKFYDCAIIRYEDILEHPKESIASLCAKLNLRTKDFFTEVNEYINNYSNYKTLPDGSFSRKDYYLKREYMQDLSPDTKATINKLIDKDLVRSLGYSLDI